jgi:hypothetical protein
MIYFVLLNNILKKCNKIYVLENNFVAADEIFALCGR